MSKNFWTILAASVLFAAVSMWTTPGFPDTGSVATPSVSRSELDGLADLDVSLQESLRLVEQRLDSGCEFARASERLFGVQYEAMTAIHRLGTLWREGRLRQGGFALSEVLVHDFAAVVDEARRDAVLAETLARLQAETRDGSDDARTLLARMVEIHPAAPTCLTRALEERDGERSETFRVLERALFGDGVVRSR